MTKRMQVVALCFALAAGVAGCAAHDKVRAWVHGDRGAPRACYWLSNEGQGWVKFDHVATKQECFNLNSCGPGGGASGGGCYKWATGKDAEGERW